MTIAWPELSTKGYLVVPGFLPPETCAALLADFEQDAPPQSYPHGFKLLGRRALASAKPHLEPFLADVRAHTELGVDSVSFLTLSHYITTAHVERTSYLHQDFDLDYKLTGDHVDYLNFWIPIAKPDPARSNVSMIPLDRLCTRAPACAALVGSGGHRFVVEGGKTLVHGNYGDVLDDAARAPELVLDFDIEELVETPSLAAGDLLLMRGDAIHRTQDAATARVAASIRATASRKRITRARATPPPAGDPSTPIMATIERCFAKLRRDEITIGELVAFATGSSGSLS